MFRPVGRGILAWAAASLLLGSPGVARAQQAIGGGDVIFMKGGGQQANVEILEERCDQVVYKLANSRQSVPTTEVLDVQYGNRPTRFKQAQSNIRNGRFDEALKNLDYVLSILDENSPEWMRPHTLYLKGETLKAWAPTDPSRYGEAAETFEKFVEENPLKGHHRLYPLVLRSLGETLLQSGEMAEAEAVFTKLAGVDCPGSWKVYGKFGQGLIKIKSGDNTAGRSLLADVVKQAGALPDSAGLIPRAHLEIGKAWLAEENSFGNAIDQFLKVVRSASEHFDQSGELLEPLAGAYNGLGDAHRMKAEKFGKNEDFAEAALYYMHVVILFREPPSARRHALLYAGKCSEKIGQSERAKSVFDELKSSFPTSKEAKEAGP